MLGRADAQAIAFESDFDCSDDSSFGDNDLFTGMTSIWGPDSWSSAGSGGVGANTDEPSGSFGGDAYGVANDSWDGGWRSPRPECPHPYP